MIIVDTREQKPLWDPLTMEVLSKKLDEGDYTTEQLLGKFHVERKSPSDLYGSIIQNHDRFRKELERAQAKGVKLSIFVECPYETFVRKRFPGGWRLQTPTATLRKILTTIAERYGIDFVWCTDRDEMRDLVCLHFADAEFFRSRDYV